MIYRKWTSDLSPFVCESLARELALPSNVEEGMADYRLTLCLSFFYKFFLNVLREVSPDSIPKKEASVLTVSATAIAIS